jgi:hypothetical protein
VWAYGFIGLINGFMRLVYTLGLAYLEFAQSRQALWSKALAYLAPIGVVIVLVVLLDWSS